MKKAKDVTQFKKYLKELFKMVEDETEEFLEDFDFDVAFTAIKKRYEKL